MTAEWRVVEHVQFGKCLKLYLRNGRLLEKLCEVVELLQCADDPRRVGDRKSGHLKNIYSIRLSRKYRLLYEVMDSEHVVRLYKIGNHKQVYGYD